MPRSPVVAPQLNPAGKEQAPPIQDFRPETVGLAISTLRQQVEAQAAEIAQLIASVQEIERFLGFTPGAMAKAAGHPRAAATEPGRA